MTSTLSQTPFTVTQEHIDGYKRVRKSLVCLLCDHRFRAGDTARFVFANGGDNVFRYGNFHVCNKCDGPDVLERAAELAESITRHKEMLNLLRRRE